MTLYPYLHPHNLTWRHVSSILVRARAWRNGFPCDFETTAGQACVLVALVDAGPNGITAEESGLEEAHLAAVRLELQHGHGLVIRCFQEDHAGRYILETPVDLLSVVTTERNPSITLRDVA